MNDGLIDAFGRENVCVELWNHGQPLDDHRNDALAQIAAEMDVDLVCTNNVHYATPKDYQLYTALDKPQELAFAKRRLVAAIQETAEALGNTPAVCRDAYVCPLVMSGFSAGQVIDRHFESVKDLIKYRGRTLHPAEKSLLRFLRRQVSASGRTG